MTDRLVTRLPARPSLVPPHSTQKCQTPVLPPVLPPSLASVLAPAPVSGGISRITWDGRSLTGEGDLRRDHSSPLPPPSPVLPCPLSPAPPPSLSGQFPHLVDVGHRPPLIGASSHQYTGMHLVLPQVKYEAKCIPLGD